MSGDPLFPFPFENRCIATTKRGTQCRNWIVQSQKWTFTADFEPIFWDARDEEQIRQRRCHVHMGSVTEPGRSGDANHPGSRLGSKDHPRTQQPEAPDA